MPTLATVLKTNESTIEIQRFKLEFLTASCREAVVYGWFKRTSSVRGAVLGGAGPSSRPPPRNWAMLHRQLRVNILFKALLPKVLTFTQVIKFII